MAAPSIGGVPPIFGRRAASAANDNTRLVQSARATTVVAIDVGTYGSGFAYVIRRPGEGGRVRVHLHTDWPDRSAAANGSGAGGTAATGTAGARPPAADRYPKTRTALLLRGGRGEEFGWTAVRKYCDMDEQARLDGRYFLVYGDVFKLGLQDPGRVPPGSLPEGMSPEDAFAEFLRLMKVYILSNLQQSARSLGIGGGAAAAAAAAASSTARGLVRWCLTVPAMWRDETKAAVRRAAHRAALITQIDSDELTVVLEPEAAALQLSVGDDRPHLYPAALGSPLAASAARVPAAAASAGGSSASPSGTATAAASSSPSSAPAGGSGHSWDLRPGEVFMVVDAGGGTVDITVHEVEHRGGICVLSEAQAVPGLGEMWGATAIDRAFKEHFSSKVGEEVFEAWVASHSGEWLRLMEEHWEPIKCSFDSTEEPVGPDLAPAGAAEGGGGDEDDDDDWLGGALGGGGARVPIPPTLHARLDIHTKTSLTVEYGSDDSVKLNRRTLAQLFRDPVHGVIQAANRQLDALAAAAQAPAARCSKVLLAGGFGCSRYLQAQLAAALGGRLIPGPGSGVLVPEHPAAAVLQGAVQYGLKPELVRARSSRLTYGVRTAVPYEEGMPAKFWHPAECCYYSAAGFSPFVSRGQLVEAEEVVTHVFTPLSPEQQIASVELWGTDKVDVRWIEEEDIIAAAREAQRRPGGIGGGTGSNMASGGGGGDSMRRLGEVQVILVQDEEADGDGGGGSGGRGGGGDLLGSQGDEVDERLIEVSLEFGRTEIRVMARDMLTGRRYTTRVKFACY